MNFELFALGPITSGNSKHRSKCVYELRKQFEPQLAQVWLCQPLVELDRVKNLRNPTLRPSADGVSRQVGSTVFVPIVSRRIDLAARLHITFYEREGSLGVKSKDGDIDNRVKTLIDALKVPRNEEEMGKFEYGQQVHCLLDDDGLVWNVTVARSRLLRNFEGRDQIARIAVEIVASRTSMINLSLLHVQVH